MTANQISFAELRETQRHNLAEEARKLSELEVSRTQADAARLTAEAKVQQNQLTGQHYERSDAEQRRANLAAEGIQLEDVVRRATETERAHRATEVLTGLQLQEQAVHNRAEEEVARRDAAAREEANRLREIEQRTSAFDAATRRMQAGIAAHQVDLGYAQLAETTRTHLAYEGLESARIEETSRHNIAQETETRLHNRTIEGETTKQNDRMHKLEQQRVWNETRKTSSGVIRDIAGVFTSIGGLYYGG